MSASSNEAAKRAAGEEVAGWITDGMRVGLGTGSTTTFALHAIGRRVRDEGLRIVGVPTSFAAEHLARQYAIPLTTLDEVDRLDIAVDGADEVSPSLDLIKGRGAAHTREKVVATLAERFVVLADPSKLVERLGTKAPVPVEVLPMAVGPVSRTLRRLGAHPELRMGRRKDGPVVTDQGFWVIDAHFENGLDDPLYLDQAIKGLPGVLDHGLFLGIATEALIGEEDGSVRCMGGSEVR